MRKNKIGSILMIMMVIIAVGILQIGYTSQDVQADSVQYRIYGYVEPDPVDGVQAYDAVNNGFAYFYIQNRTNEGNVADAMVTGGGGDSYDPYISLQENGETGFINDWQIGDPGIMVIEREIGTYGTNDRAGYIAFQNGTLIDLPPQVFDNCTLQRIPEPVQNENGTGYINISWTPLVDTNMLIAGYKVYRSETNASDPSWTLVGGDVNNPLTGTDYNDTSVVSGTMYYYAIKVCFTGYQNDNPGSKDNYQNQFFGVGSVAMSAVVSILSVDYIVITDSPTPGGVEVINITINIGKSTPSVYAAGYNNTGPTFVGAVEVVWTPDPPTLGGCSPTPSTFTVFTALFQGGSVNITGENSTMVMGDNFTVYINPPTIDNILLTDSPGGSEIASQPIDQGMPVLIYASGFNNTGSTFVGLVDVDWTDVPDFGNFNNDTGTSSTFTGTTNGITTIMGDSTLLGLSDTFQLNILPIPATINYIQINDAFGPGGVALVTVDLGVGESGTGYAAGYNGTSPTGTYVGPVDVVWSQAPLILGTFNPTTGSSSTYTADNVQWGTTTITGTNATYGADSFTMNVLEPTVDWIDIVDTALTGATTVPNQAVNVRDTITGFAAKFNITAGYFGDISVNWTVTPGATEDASTLPLTGITSDFDAGTMGGTVTWMADDLAGHTDSVIITITPPNVDSIMIVDTEATGGVDIPDQTVDAGFIIQGWAAAFNVTIGYISDVAVTWTLVNASGAEAFIDILSGSSGTNTTFNSGPTNGDATLTANYTGVIATVVFTIDIIYTIDHITIVDTQNTGLTEIAEQIVDVGFTITGYVAAFNTSKPGTGYLYDVSVSWSVDAVGTTLPASDLTSTFDAGLDVDGGVATWTADDGAGHTDTVVFIVREAVADYILIVDGAEGSGSEVGTDSLTVGDSEPYHCAAYNTTAGYIDDVEATWAVIDGIGTVNPETGTLTLFNATTAGTGTVTATYTGLTDATGVITVTNVTDTTPPAAPVGLVVNQVAAGGALNLAWTANTDDAVGYNVYRSTSATTGFTLLNTAGLITDNAYSDTTVTEGTTYYYRITAVDDSANESPDSATASNTADRDTDGDSTYNLQDDDDDGDTLTDAEEATLGTNPLLVDTDGDGHNDAEDKYPLDASKWKDDDGDDGIPVILLLLPIIIIIILLLLFVMMKKGKPKEEMPPPEMPEEEVPPPEEEVPPPEEEMPPEEEVPPPEEEMPSEEEEVLPPEEEMPSEEEVPPSEEEVSPPEEEVPPPDEPAPPSEDEFPPPP